MKDITTLSETPQRQTSVLCVNLAFSIEPFQVSRWRLRRAGQVCQWNGILVLTYHPGWVFAARGAVICESRRRPYTLRPLQSKKFRNTQAAPSLAYAKRPPRQRLT